MHTIFQFLGKNIQFQTEFTTNTYMFVTFFQAMGKMPKENASIWKTESN